MYFGHDHNCQAVNSASLTIVGPTSGLPVVFISATQGSDPPAYQKGTGTQIDTTEGAFYVELDGSFALYGIFIKSGGLIAPANDTNESFVSHDCTFAPAANSYIDLSWTTDTTAFYKNLTVNLTQDGSTNRTQVVFLRNNESRAEFNGLTFVNAAFRTGTIFGGNGSGDFSVAGADFSGFTNATLCELFAGSIAANVSVTDCKTAATFALVDSAAPTTNTRILATNVGSTDNPAALDCYSYFGRAASSILIYRSSGATVEGINTSWLVTTTATCNEYAPFHSPWIYGVVSSTGSKNFDLFVTNDTADFTDAKVWLEVEYLATSDSALWTLASDQRATITTTAADQDDDTTSTWVGAGPVYTYKQRLRVTATVGETGQFRARVVTGVASIASSRNFYVDPLVTVT